MGQQRHLRLLQDKLLSRLLLFSALLFIARPSALQAPAVAAEGPVRFTIRFEQERYPVSPGETFPVRVLISPVPANGLFSYGIRLVAAATNARVNQASAIQPGAGLNFNGVLGAPAVKQIAN